MSVWRRLALVACGLIPGLAAAQQGATSFYTVVPCRLVDTRNAAGSRGGPAVSPGLPRAFPVGGLCGVSSGASAVSINVTAVTAPSAGYLTLSPTGPYLPPTANVGFGAGATRAASTVMGLGQGGSLQVVPTLGGTGPVHVVIDVNGYFADPLVEAGGVAAPAFDPPPGSYQGGQSVTLRTSTPGASMRYTLDGSDPSTTDGTFYSGPLQVAATAELRAVAYVGGVSSALAQGLYALPGGSELYLTSLVPQCSPGVLGSGSASLQLSADATYAEVRFTRSNLTGPITSMHVHAPDGQILFDLDSVTPVMGVYRWDIVPAGTYSVAAILSALRAGQLYLNLHTGACPNGEIRGTFARSTGSPTFVPPLAPPSLPSSFSRADAARFLQQATFGAKMSEIDSLAAALAGGGTAGFENWLNGQFSQPVTTHLGYLDWLVGQGVELDAPYFFESFWQRAIQGPDPLRQRVAFALSEILVVSNQDDDVYGAPEGLADYVDHLQRNAFGNFRDLLEDVTLSPVMGVYLDMLSNDKEDPETGQLPNENFGREILQLFTIGLYQLYPDGTLKLGADGLPIATYDQEVIKGFAAVFTGWTHAGQDRSEDWHFYWPEPSWRQPMESWEEHHEPGSKLLLDGFVQPGNQGAVADLTAARDRIFNHSNLGPFLCRQLIQRLVTSNPSPGYVYRCGQAFANDGTGERGDLRAVVRSILMDYEARSPALIAQEGYGKLREPIVRFAGLLRQLDATAADGRYRYYWIDSPEWGIAQMPLHAPTVFNFYEPTYASPGEVAGAGLVSPEFKITTETSVFGTPNFLRGILVDGWMNDDQVLQIDWSPWLGLNDTQRLDRLQDLLFGGRMSAETRAILSTALADEDFPTDPTERAIELIWLTFMSPEALVQK